MKSFSEFYHNMLSEKLITFGGKAYPKFGQVVILAGGAGSGKGFVSSNLLGIEGNTMDVDALKQLAIKSDKFAKRVKEETGQDLKRFDLKKSENVSKLHELLSDVYGITKSNERRIFTAALAAPADRKPNLIFDVTLKDMAKLAKITRNVDQLGYEKQNIHIVWVVNDVEVAVSQNKNRNRVVPQEILMATHEGASMTMRKIVDADTKLSRYMDGDIWFAFNKAGVDTKLVKSELGGQYISDANYIQIKKKGKKPLSKDEIGERILQKIAQYTPELKTWAESKKNAYYKIGGDPFDGGVVLSVHVDGKEVFSSIRDGIDDWEYQGKDVTLNYILKTVAKKYGVDVKNMKRIDI